VEARKASATVLAVAECKSRPTLSEKLSGKKARPSLGHSSVGSVRGNSTCENGLEFS